MHVQSVQKYCFSLSNMQICGVCVALVVVVAQRHAKNSSFLHIKHKNHSSFRSYSFRSTTAIRRSLRQPFFEIGVYIYTVKPLLSGPPIKRTPSI